MNRKPEALDFEQTSKEQANSAVSTLIKEIFLAERSRGLEGSNDGFAYRSRAKNTRVPVGVFRITSKYTCCSQLVERDFETSQPLLS